MNDDHNVGCVPAAVLGAPRPRVAAGRRTHRRRGAVWALLGALVVVLGGAVLWAEAPRGHDDVVSSTGATSVAALDDDADQQTMAAHLAADIAGMPTPAPAARVSAACDLVGRLTGPVTADVDRWVIENCVADQQPHDGARYDIGPLNRD